MTEETCAFCRVGSCGVHALRRIVRDKRPVYEDREMIPVACCDRLEAAVFLGLLKRDVDRSGSLAIASKMGALEIAFCPFCGGRI